jgi:3-methyladenine DNA glycosylase AlkD
MNLAAATQMLATKLEASASPAVREHWEGHMKGAAAFRGVPMADVRRAMKAVWREHALADESTVDLLILCHHWFRQPATEDKLAAVLMIAEQYSPRLIWEDADALALPFIEGSIADWNVCDWYRVKALHTYLVGAPDLPERAVAIAGWSRAPSLWQRRAAVVAFVKLAPRADKHFDGFIDLVFGACAANLVSPERFAHTGPGWVLRELSKAAPAEVAQFVTEHPELSNEGRRMATAHIRPAPYRRR